MASPPVTPAKATSSTTPRSFTSKRRSQIFRMKAELQLCMDTSNTPAKPLVDSSNVQLTNENHKLTAQMYTANSLFNGLDSENELLSSRSEKPQDSPSPKATSDEVDRSLTNRDTLPEFHDKEAKDDCDKDEIQLEGSSSVEHHGPKDKSRVPALITQSPADQQLDTLWPPDQREVCALSPIAKADADVSTPPAGAACVSPLVNTRSQPAVADAVPAPATVVPKIVHTLPALPTHLNIDIQSAPGFAASVSRSACILRNVLALALASGEADSSSALELIIERASSLLVELERAASAIEPQLEIGPRIELPTQTLRASFLRAPSPARDGGSQPIPTLEGGLLTPTSMAVKQPLPTTPLATAAWAGTPLRTPLSLRSATIHDSTGTPSYGARGAAVARLQAVWRGVATRARWGQAAATLGKRGRAAHELIASERSYLAKLELLISRFYLPLQNNGLPPKSLRTIFGNLQVLLNLSRSVCAQLEVASAASSPMAELCSIALLSALPSLKMYQQYVTGYHTAQQELSKLTREDSSFVKLISDLEAEGNTNERLSVLLLTPVRRVPNYAMYIERFIKLTQLDAPERDGFCRTLEAVQELCNLLDRSLADNESRVKVAALHAEFDELLGDPMAHRRFLFEGELRELQIDRGRVTASTRHVVLFNDGLLVTTGPTPGSREATECISLAKVQVKLVPELFDCSTPFGFELWSIAKVWRFSVATEKERATWVGHIQTQVRFLLASFKQRGKSLAFIPQSVSMLRERLYELVSRRANIEEQVVELTTEISMLDEQSTADRKRLAFWDRANSHRSLSVAPPTLSELEEMRSRVKALDETRAHLQESANKHIAELFELGNVLEAIDEKHNDDSLLQFMLFSSV